MSKPIIAVDADDTLFDENDAVRQFFNDTYGTNHTIEDYLVEGFYDTYWESIWNRSTEETWKIYEKFLASKYVQDLPPIDGAIEALIILKRDYELVIVTSRDKRNVDITHQSLEKHYPKLFSDVHFVALWGNGEKVTKAAICDEIGASYLIDDNFDHCKLATESGVKAMLYGDYGWNRTQALPAGVTRCRTWKDVLTALSQLS